MSAASYATDHTLVQCTTADDIAKTADENLSPDGLDAKELMVGNDANVAAAEEALKLSKKTPTDHWWATIESFERKLVAAKKQRDNDRWTINEKFKGKIWKLPDETEVEEETDNDDYGGPALVHHSFWIRP